MAHSYSSASLTSRLPAPEKLANLFTDATKERKTGRERPLSVEQHRRNRKAGGQGVIGKRFRREGILISRMSFVSFIVNGEYDSRQMHVVI